MRQRVVFVRAREEEEGGEEDATGRRERFAHDNVAGLLAALVLCPLSFEEEEEEDVNASTLNDTRDTKIQFRKRHKETTTENDFPTTTKRMNRTRRGRGKRRTLSSSLFLLLALLFALFGAKNNAARCDDRYEEELEYTGEENEETMNERVPSARGDTSRTARNGRGETVSPRNNVGNTFAQLAGERVGPDVVSLGSNAEQLKLTQFETRMMSSSSGKQAMFVSVLPEDRSIQCQEKIDEWYPTFRKVGRAMDSAYKVMEVSMPGRTAQAIGEVFGKMKKQEARKFACGVIALFESYGNLNIFKGNYSDPVDYVEFLSSARGGMTDLRRAGEKAMKFGSSIESSSSIDDDDNKHAACDWLAKPRRNGDDKMRVAVFEPVDEDVFNFIATVIGEKNAALFSRQSLFGCEVTVGQPVRESYGITLVADIDESDDGFNEDAEIKVMPILANKKSGFNPRLGKEDFIDFIDQVILANATSAFRELVETSVDTNCANDIWEMITNLNDQFYEEVARKKQLRQTQDDGEGEEGLDEHFSPEIAWDTIREPVLKALDAHGKNDKNLQPTQWMCGLAGSIAAFAEAKSELAQANALMGELMTLRKESIQLRTRNAVLERELAEMETRMPAGGANSDAMGLPKAKKRGFGATTMEKNTPKPKPSFKEDRLQQEQQQQEEEEAKEKAKRDAEERQRAAEERRAQEERVASEEARRREEEEAAAAEAAALRQRDEEIETMRQQQQAAAEAQRRQEEESEALRIKQEVETSANIPPSSVEDEDANLAFWSAHENGGRTYYYNSRTHESTYEKPAGFNQPEKSKNEAQHVEL